MGLRQTLPFGLWLVCMAMAAATAIAATAPPAASTAQIRWDEQSVRAGGAKGLVELRNGHILATHSYYVDGGFNVFCWRSTDGGKTWHELAVILRDEDGSDVGDGCLMERSNGEVWYSYRRNLRLLDHFKKPSFSINVAVSRDQGATWAFHSTVEAVTPSTGADPSRGLWASALLEKRDGTVQCYYDDENAPFLADFRGHQWVQMKTWNPAARQWQRPVTVSRAYDPRHLSRDGMPSVVELPGGRLVCTVESCAVTPPYANLIRMVTSDDGGKTWSWQKEERPVVYQTAKKDFLAVAPWLARLTDGTLVCVFATDEDRETPHRPGTPPPKLNTDVKCVLSTDDGQTWSKPASTVDSNSHQDYMPGVVELRHGGGKNTVLCVWADTRRGRAWAKGGTLERQ